MTVRKMRGGPDASSADTRVIRSITSANHSARCGSIRTTTARTSRSAPASHSRLPSTSTTSPSSSTSRTGLAGRSLRSTTGPHPPGRLGIKVPVRHEVAHAEWTGRGGSIGWLEMQFQVSVRGPVPALDVRCW